LIRTVEPLNTPGGLHFEPRFEAVEWEGDHAE
jgi:hypothetical protein